MKTDNIRFLLDYCNKIPELYNEVANHLYDRFDLRHAEISLLVTYYISEVRRRAQGTAESCSYIKIDRGES